MLHFFMRIFFTLLLKVGGHKQKDKAEAHIYGRKHFLTAKGEIEESDFPGEKEESDTNSSVDLMYGFRLTSYFSCSINYSEKN